MLLNMSPSKKLDYYSKFVQIFFHTLFAMKFCIHSIMFLIKRNMAMDSVGLNEILFLFFRERRAQIE